jgi:hypothetical protein
MEQASIEMMGASVAWGSGNETSSQKFV